jgi:hypothetical protein
LSEVARYVSVDCCDSIDDEEKLLTGRCANPAAIEHLPTRHTFTCTSTPVLSVLRAQTMSGRRYMYSSDILNLFQSIICNYDCQTLHGTLRRITLAFPDHRSTVFLQSNTVCVTATNRRYLWQQSALMGPAAHCVRVWYAVYPINIRDHWAVCVDGTFRN